MTRTFVHIVALVVSTGVLVGCGAKAKPIAMALPLKPLVSWPSGETFKQNKDFRVVRRADGLTVIGTRGAALNAATQLHRQLLDLKIPNEIVCVLGAVRAEQSLHVAFPTELTPAQRETLAKVIDAINHRG